MIAIWALLRLSDYISRQRIKQLVAADMRSRVQYVGALRKISAIAIVVVGVLTLAGQMGYKIPPLLTGLGIGGLAVALALQDTLANLFAGFYMMFDQPVHVGDYIQLKSGEEGFVQEIGWRNTRIRPWSNSDILIPNSVLSQTIFTNHYLPAQELSVVVECGVSYYSKLANVEQVTLEVATEVLARVEGSARAWEPRVYFHTFGDSNVEFRVVLRAQEFSAQYQLKSEFIKALHERFAAEGIEISFPMRKVEFSQVPPEPMPPASKLRG
ncbi:MAG: mechanosensitive ion channel family protein [Armatimonadota bacterium]